MDMLRTLSTTYLRVSNSHNKNIDLNIHNQIDGMSIAQKKHTHTLNRTLLTCLFVVKAEKFRVLVLPNVCIGTMSKIGAFIWLFWLLAMIGEANRPSLNSLLIFFDISRTDIRIADMMWRFVALVYGKRVDIDFSTQKTHGTVGWSRVT